MKPQLTVIREAFKLLRALSIHPAFFLLPAALALVASLFEAATLTLLIPLVEGIIRMDVGLLREVPVLGKIFSAFPDFFATNRSVFAAFILFVFFAAVFKHVFQYQSLLLSAAVVRRFSDRLRRFVFDRYLGFNKLFYDRNSSGHLHEILMGFTNRIEAGLMRFEGMLSHIFLLTVYMAVLFAISWEVTLAALGVFPILHYSMQWLIRKIRRTSLDFADSVGLLGKKISNILTGIQLIKASGTEEAEKKRFAAMSNAVRRLQYSIDKKAFLVNPLQEIIILLSVLVLVSIMAFLVIRGGREDAIASFLVYFYVLKRAGGTFGTLNQIRTVIAGLEGPIRQMQDILTLRQEYMMEGGGKDFGGLRHYIELKDLQFAYSGGPLVLKGLNLKIQAGQKTALVGATGSGKTTLAHLLLRFYDCPPDSILLDGEDIRSFKIHSLRRHIAFVSQEALLFHDTLKANLLYGLEREVGDEELMDALRRSRLHGYVMNLPQGLKTQVGDRGVQLSGGEKQRVAIARAILKNAEILILDEATSALDSSTEKLIQEALDEVARDRTAIIIAHRLSTVQNAEEIIVLEDGRLVEKGRFDELVSGNGKFCEFWTEQRRA